MPNKGSGIKYFNLISQNLPELDTVDKLKIMDTQLAISSF
jgi:hypothetical protein